MPKKKPVASGFGVFMKELQEKKFLREGRRIPLRDMKDIADPLWQKLTVEERLMYNQQAKQVKRDGAERLASDGTSLQANQEEIEEVERQRHKMILNIREFVNSNEYSHEEYKMVGAGLEFFVIHFNILCYAEGEYIPLEVAIVEYSILNGIQRHYHKLIHPGPVPTGFRGEAKRISESSHLIDATGAPDCERRLDIVMNEIEDFLCASDEGRFPPVFIIGNDIEAVRGCLEWLSRKTGYNVNFRVWDLAWLLVDLRAGVGDPLPSEFIAQDLLDKSSFDYQADSRCDFHENLDSKYCSLGVVRRLCYLMSDCLCGIYEIDMTTKHLPNMAMEIKPYEIHHPTFVTTNFKPQHVHKPSKASELDSFSDDDDDPLSTFPRLSVNDGARGQGMGRGMMFRN